MNRYKKLSVDIILITIGQTSTKLLSLLLLPLFTGILSTKEYGVYDLVITTVSLLSPVMTMVVYEAVIRFCLDGQYDPSKILSIGLAFTLSGTLLFALASPLLGRLGLTGDFPLLVVAYFFAVNTHNVIGSYIKGIDRVKLYSAFGVLSSAFVLSLNLIFVVVMRLGAAGFLLGGAAGCLLSWCVVQARCDLLRKITNPFKIEREIYKAVTAYTLPLIPNSISWWVSNSSDKFMLKVMAGVSCVGVYSVAYKVPTLITVISSIFISAWQISAVKDFGSKESADFFSGVYRVFSSFNIVLVSALICFSKIIGTLLYSRDFFAAWKPSMIIFFAYIFNSMSVMLGSIYTSAKKTKPIFYSTAAAALFNIAMNYFLIKACGMHGAAIATCLSYMLIWLIRLADSRRIMALSVDYIRDIVSYALIIVQIAVMYLDAPLSLCAAAIIAAAVFAINGRKLINRKLLELIKTKREA